MTDPSSHAPRTLDDFCRSGADAPTSGPSGSSHAELSWLREAEEVCARLRLEGAIGEEWVRRIRWHVVRTPGLLRRAGVGGTPRPADLSVEHLHAVRDNLGWSRNTLSVYYSALRRFLRAKSHPLATMVGPWKLPSGDPTHRRWLRSEDLLRLLGTAEGPERVLIALEGFNALRRIEVKRLHVRDLDLVEGRIRVCGKGRGGGKWRTIPLTQTASTELRPWVEGRAGDALVLPRSASGLDLLLSRAAKRAGFRGKVSNHDLRRTFGRVAYQSGMALVDLKNFMGHASVDMTAHYIGLDEDHMREGLARFNERMSPLLDRREGRAVRTADPPHLGC